MKILLHPTHTQLSEFIHSIPQGGYQVDETFCQKRNTVQKTTFGAHAYVIKKYKCPTLFNRVVYTWFRKSKARRSYEYALRLLESGIHTAPPIAYIEIRKGLFFHTGYYISAHLDYPLLNQVVDLEQEEQRKLMNDFIEFTAQLHEKGILHRDYNKGNIFYFKENGKYNFALIDINRVQFSKIGKRNSMRAFDQLGIPIEYLFSILSKYSKFRNWNIKESLITYLILEQERSFQRKIKRMIKETLRLA